MTPNALATKLVGAANAEQYGKAVIRPYLRKHFTRDASVKGSGWTLDAKMIAEVTAMHKARVAGKAFDTAAYRKALRARKPKAKTAE